MSAAADSEELAARDAAARAAGRDPERSCIVQAPAGSGKTVWHAMLDHGEVGAGRMHACGVAVVNPPYGLDSQLSEPLGWMAAKLARGPRATHRLEWIEG